MKDDSRQNAPRCVTPRELSEFWRIDIRTLDKLELPWNRVGRQRRLRVDVANEFAKRNNWPLIP